MKDKSVVISNIIILIIIIVGVFTYNKYDYNFYSKGVMKSGLTEFSRDNKIKTSKNKSYKMVSNDYNDAMFYKKIEVKKNTPYKVTCKIKTKDVVGFNNDILAGAQICIPATEEHSNVIQGNTDWTEVFFYFNSKNNQMIDVGFRIGGNLRKAKGTAWFSDLKIEEGVADNSNTWKFGCFILENANVCINNEQKSYKMNSNEISLVYNNMSRLKNSIKNMSNNQMNINYEIIRINEPLTSLSYDQENGYYINESNIYNLINSYQMKKEYDHIFVCTNLPLESKLTRNADVCEWIGLGSMMYLGKGLSNIRIIPDNYTYSKYNTFPEEVFLHEFLHTLERNAEEYGYKIPRLHDLEKYNYKDDPKEGQRKWYIDYMNCRIKTPKGNIGLPHEIYTLKPINSSNFIYSYELDKLKEPETIKECIDSIIYKLKQLFNVKKENKEIEKINKREY